MSIHAAVTCVGVRHSRAFQIAGEAALTVAVVLTYFGIRHLSHSDPAAALRHASWIHSVEVHLRLDHEAWIQQRVLPHHALVTVFDDIYIYGHWPVIVVALGWLLWRHPAHFSLARNAMMASGTLALAVFAFFPVAPPRLADPAIVDTVTRYSAAYRVLQPPAFTDAYAALPSLHCGWDLVIAVTVATVASHRLTKIMLYVLPAAMVAAVIVTGNHYVLDAVAGDTLALSGIAFARRLQRRAEAEHPEPPDHGRRRIRRIRLAATHGLAARMAR